MDRKKQEPTKALSELEHLVMQLLWSKGPATAEQIREGLAPQRRLKDSTIRTVLRRLEEKRYVKHVVDGRTFIYSGAVTAQRVAANAVRRIMDRFFAGSLEQLIVGMVDSRVVDESDIERLRRELENR